MDVTLSLQYLKAADEKDEKNWVTIAEVTVDGKTDQSNLPYYETAGTEGKLSLIHIFTLLLYRSTSEGITSGALVQITFDASGNLLEPIWTDSNQIIAGYDDIDAVQTVSYTHLDVYKRQMLSFLKRKKRRRMRMFFRCRTLTLKH